jgi:hypothetical protein
LGEKRLELLAVALLDQAAIDVPVRLLAVEELLEIGEAIGPDAVVRKVKVLEVEIPVIELVVGVAGEKGAFDARDMAQAVRLNIRISRPEDGGSVRSNCWRRCRCRGSLPQTWRAVRLACRLARRQLRLLVPGFDG